MLQSPNHAHIYNASGHLESVKANHGCAWTLHRWRCVSLNVGVLSASMISLARTFGAARYSIRRYVYLSRFKIPNGSALRRRQARHVAKQSRKTNTTFVSQRHPPPVPFLGVSYTSGNGIKRLGSALDWESCTSNQSFVRPRSACANPLVEARNQRTLCDFVCISSEQKEKNTTNLKATCWGHK